MTKEKILELTGASDLVALNNVIALIYPYKPFEDSNDILKLDSYYVASNIAYIKAKQANLGTITNNLNIKDLLSKCGFKRGFSSLMIHPVFGSYFLVQTLIPTFKIDDIRIANYSLVCENCNKCIHACPSKAIKTEGYVRDVCIRSMMDLALSSNTINYLGNELLGCQICRKICPHNSKIQPAEIPIELCEILNIVTILSFDKTTRDILTKYIGSNMARASIILPQAMAIAYKNNRLDLIPLIERLLHHPSNKVSASAAIILDKLTLNSN